MMGPVNPLPDPGGIAIPTARAGRGQRPARRERGTHHVHRQRTTQPKPAAASAAATWWHTGEGVTVIRDGATPEGTLPTVDRPRGRACIGH